jgi:hypothetical protein
MEYTIIKKVFRTQGFDIKPDVQDWVLADLEHMARVIIRKTKKCPIVAVNYMGIWHDNKPIAVNETWADLNPRGSYMKFEVILERKVPKGSRRTNIEDILNQLVMEAI